MIGREINDDSSLLIVLRLSQSFNFFTSVMKKGQPRSITGINGLNSDQNQEKSQNLGPDQNQQIYENLGPIRTGRSSDPSVRRSLVNYG